MLNYRFFFVTAFVTLATLILVIYLDSRDRDRERSGIPDETYISAESGTQQQQEYPAPDHDRIQHFTSVLDTLTDNRARLPYYGALIQLYADAGRFLDAGSWAEKRAVSTGSSEDWEMAGSYYFEAVRRHYGADETSKHAGRKAEAAYRKAINLKPDDTDLRTDLAVVYMGLLKPDESYNMLKQVLDAEPGHIRANFNTGVLLHQMGSAGESIPFFDKALTMAQNSEWETIVQDYLDRHHNDIYH